MMTIGRSVTRLATVAAIAGAFAAGGGIASRADDAPPAGDPANGKRLYLADGCFECHGRAGQGGRFNYLTPALAQIALPVESFIAFLREAPNDMPSFSGRRAVGQGCAPTSTPISARCLARSRLKDIPPILNQ